MLDELRFAIRCHGSTKKPALRRHCQKCARYCPSDHCAVESPNGGFMLKDIDHKSPTMLSHRHNNSRPETTAFRYNLDDVTTYTAEYTDHSHRNQKT